MGDRMLLTSQERDAIRLLRLVALRSVGNLGRGMEAAQVWEACETMLALIVEPYPSTTFWLGAEGG